MTREQQQEHFHTLAKRLIDIMASKGDDYAGSEDRLKNFKVAGAITGLTPQQHCLSLIATKVARLGNLLSGRVPSNESVIDSIEDLINYGILLHMIQDERIDTPSRKADSPGKVAPSDYTRI